MSTIQRTPKRSVHMPKWSCDGHTQAGRCEPVMSAWARLVVDCRRAGVHRTVRLTDALIAATAIAHGLPVVTRDDDFDRVATAHALLRVVRV